MLLLACASPLRPDVLLIAKAMKASTTAEIFATMREYPMILSFLPKRSATTTKELDVFEKRS